MLLIMHSCVLRFLLAASTPAIRDGPTILADRTNGRAIGTLLRPSVVCRL